MILNLKDSLFFTTQGRELGSLIGVLVEGAVALLAKSVIRNGQ